MNYSEKLKDPRWQKKRLEILQRDGFCCQYCYDDEKTLHVHHLYYQKGGEPWEIDNKYLTTLCEDCHSRETEARKHSNDLLIKTFSKFSSYQINQVCDALLHFYDQVHFDMLGHTLSFALTNEEMIELIKDKFHEHCKRIVAEKSRQREMAQ